MTPIKTVSLPLETYNMLKAQAVEAERTLTGQIKYLLKKNENTNKQGK